MKHTIKHRMIAFSIVLSMVMTGLFIPVEGKHIDAVSGEKHNAKEGNISVIIKEINFTKPRIEDHGSYIKFVEEGIDSYTVDYGLWYLIPKKFLFFPLIRERFIELKFPVHISVFTFPLGTEIINVSCSIPSIKTINNVSINISTPLLNHTYILPRERWYSLRIGGGLHNGNRSTILAVHFCPVKFIYSQNKSIVQYVEKAKIIVKYREKRVMSQKKLYDLLVITPCNFLSTLNPLIEHKKSIGIKTKLVTLGEIYDGAIFPVKGRDNSEKIKYFIKDAIENWGIRYVLLVGDSKKMPVRYIQSSLISRVSFIIFFHLEKYDFISDLYYADIYDAEGNFCSWDSNNNGIFGEIKLDVKNSSTDFPLLQFLYIDKLDLHPDVYIGRIPCKNKDELEIVVNKIISYENEVYDESWLKNITICAGDTFPPSRLLYLMAILVCSKIYNRNIISSLFFKEGEYVGDRISEEIKGFNFKKLYASQFSPTTDKKPLNKKNIKEEIENGAVFVLFIGHGSSIKWGTYRTFSLLGIKPSPLGYLIRDVYKLNNKDKLPVVILDACSCADFSKGDCLAWSFLKSENGGSIASIGYTSFAYSGMGIKGKNGIEELDAHVDLTMLKLYKKGVHHTGDLMADTIHTYLTKCQPFRNRVDLLSLEDLEKLELFGDPTLMIGGYPPKKPKSQPATNSLPLQWP